MRIRVKPQSLSEKGIPSYGHTICEKNELVRSLKGKEMKQYDVQNIAGTAMTEFIRLLRNESY